MVAKRKIHACCCCELNPGHPALTKLHWLIKLHLVLYYIYSITAGNITILQVVDSFVSFWRLNIWSWILLHSFCSLLSWCSVLWQTDWWGRGHRVLAFAATPAEMGGRAWYKFL